MIVATVAAGLVLALIAAIVISVGARGSDAAAGPSTEAPIQAQNVVDSAADDDPSAAADPVEPSDSTVSTTPTPRPTPAREQPTADPEPAIDADVDNDDGPQPAVEADQPAEHDDGEDNPGGPIEPGEPSEQPVEDHPAGEPLPSLEGSGGQVPPPPSYELPDFPEEVPAVPTDPTPLPEIEIPAPVPLDVEPPVTPEPLPEQVPDPVVALSPVAQGAADQLTGNAFGCASRCITKALLHPNIHDANLELEVRTTVATSKIVWVLPAGPIIGPDGVPAYLGKPIAGGQLSPAHEWTTTLDNLQADVSYRIVVAATDNQKNTEVVSTVITTSKPTPDQLVAPGSPCLFECIVDGLVTPGADFGKALLIVHADAPVTFDVAVSPSQPYTVSTDIDGRLYLLDDVTLTDVQAGPSTYQARAIGMSPETTYYVLVTATDEQGNFQQATGSFATAAAPAQPEPQPLPPEPEIETHNVFMWVDRFHIHHTGDGIGKGEIAFRWGIRDYEDDEQDTFTRDFEKIGQGESVGAGGTRMVQIADGDFLPPVILNAYESDATWGDDFCLVEVGDEPIASQSKVMCELNGPTTGGDTTVTAARLDAMRLGDALALPTCDTFGISGPAGEARCVVVKSLDPGDGYVQFDTLVGIWIQ